MKILVCGGAGYIGSHVAKAIHRAGHQPVVFDNFSAGHEWAVRWGELVRGDLSNPSDIRSALRTHGIEAVIQLAGSINVGESMRDPGKYFRNNFSISVNLLEAMQAEGVKNIVFSSTAAVYGVPESSPIPEDAVKQPINPYGEAKYFTERLLNWFSQSHGFRCLALRYFNAAGADPDLEIGEMHSPETHLIPLIIYAALGKRPPVKVFGTDYPTPDGTAVRDYIHVSDLARAHVLGVEYLAAGNDSTAFNLGTGTGASVLEVLKAVEKVSGAPVPHELGPRREGDPPALVAQSVMARQALGWTPQYSSLESIVETAWGWSRKAIADGLYSE
jgi:UDP-glucose-4-epimerase GalE